MPSWAIALLVGVGLAVVGVFVGHYLAMRKYLGKRSQLEINEAIRAGVEKQRGLSDGAAFEEWKKNFGGPGDGNHN